MATALVEFVYQRAGGRCEYCLLPQDCIGAPHEVDHIIGKQHGGKTIAANLALACFACSRHKGPNIAGWDSDSGQAVKLFNPRRQKWAAHFRLRGSKILGKTPTGRATVKLLAMNNPMRIILRSMLIREGRYQE
jgi:hypothetical protein